MSPFPPQCRIGTKYTLVFLKKLNFWRNPILSEACCECGSVCVLGKRNGMHINREMSMRGEEGRKKGKKAVAVRGRSSAQSSSSEA